MKQYVKMLLLIASFVVLGASTVLAETTQSPNFELSEPEFGAGSALETCSGNYCAQASIGDTGGGSASDGVSTATFSGGLGAVTEPLFEVIVDPGVSHLGVLSTDATAYKTSSIKIRTYMSDGYTVQLIGDPPRYGEHVLQAPSSPTASTPGTEQFAINATTNNLPDEVGANPTYEPSSEMSFGYAMPDYATSNMFKYQSGDVIAKSDKESGQTNYTLTMIVNVGGSTPAGHFTGEYSVVVIPAF